MTDVFLTGGSRLSEDSQGRTSAPGSRDTRSRGIAATLARLWLRLRYRILGRRYGRLVLEAIEGVPLVVLPHVFNPVLLRSGALMARAIARLPLEAAPGGLPVLDLGTGSGVGAIFAARRGASVVAVDINSEAIRCTRINALLNHVDERIEVHQGDLFDPVRGRRFDLVLFNPPYYRGAPVDALDHAWRGEHVFERFAAGLGEVLTPDGYALLVLSTDGQCDELLVELAAAGFRWEAVERTDLINEVVTIYAVRRRRASAAPGR
jgi:release factor glutamine methyltransferase